MPDKLSFGNKEIKDVAIPHEVSVNPVTGEAAISVSVPLPEGRGTVRPSLSLAYGSGSGNSVLGMGWSLVGISSIDIFMKYGFPKYDGSDRYSFQGQELIPALEKKDGKWVPRIDENERYFVFYHIARVDPEYTRFEKWVRKDDGSVHWRIHGRNNEVSIFGRANDDSTKICDPRDNKKVFKWLMEARYDNTGNAVEYEYIPEDTAHVDTRPTYEWNRFADSGGNAQKHLKRIRYGNSVPVYPGDASDPLQKWHFEIVMDYGEHFAGDQPVYSPDVAEWPARKDPFSSYAAGFEQRTYRLCRGIIVFHDFIELGDGPSLEGYMAFTHDERESGTILEKIHYTGYRRIDRTDSYDSRTIPPLVFEYTIPRVESSFRPAPEQGRSNAPLGLSGGAYKWLDLYGEGLPGILYESDTCWYYKANLGGGRLGEQELVAEKPSSGFGNYALSDFDGDGNLDLVVLQGRESGYFEYDRERGEWNGYRPFGSSPHVRSMDNHTQLIDLTGDGKPDIITVEEDRIVVFPSEGKNGFGAPVQIAKPPSNGVSRAPAVGADLRLDYFFADMTGSGLQDQVRVSNGRVEYWPNLGNGRFGAGIAMEGSPVLDFQSALDAGRIRLVDLDGSGTADLVYIGRGEIRYWMNACGNRFVPGGAILGLPYIDNVSSAQVIDFTGDGTPCLVWSSFLPVHTDAPLNYLRLTDGIKPGLIVKASNSMGRETVFSYGNSGAHYLRDRESGTPWITRLPSHRTVVDCIEFLDGIGNTRFQERYEYHDGFFDGDDRSFRGFSLVDRYDSQSFDGVSAEEGPAHSEPSCTRTWLHNGAAGRQRERSAQFHASGRFGIEMTDFFVEDASELGKDEYFQAARGLAGRPIRIEIYGLTRDGKRKAHPFKVMQKSYAVRRIQPSGTDRDAGFAVFESESLDIVYEESPRDPKVSHSFNLSIDGYGVPVLQAAIAYPRTSPDAEPEQKVLLAMAVKTDAASFESLDRYEAGIELAKRGFELRIASLGPGDSPYDRETVARKVEQAIDGAIGFNEPFTTGDQARIIRWSRNLFSGGEGHDALPWGEIGPKVLLHHSEKACFNDEFLRAALGAHYDPSLAPDGHYLFHDGLWWQPGAAAHYLGRDGFFLLDAETRPDGGKSEYAYDAYRLNMTGVTNLLAGPGGTILAENTARAEIDYNVLAPYRITDANDNVSEVLYDPLGVPVRSTMYGTVLSESGTMERYGHDSITDSPAPPVASFDRIADDPGAFLGGCASYLYYEPDSWLREGIPVRSIACARENWVYDGTGRISSEGAIQVRIDYTDGFGRSIQSKTLVEPGPCLVRRDDGTIVTGDDGSPVIGESSGPRWLVSGHVVYDNKQQPVRRYEPFFSELRRFESEDALRRFGVSEYLEYDALGRQKRLVRPDGAVSSVEITPWETMKYDPNDSVAGSPYERRIEAGYAEGTPERAALEQSRPHDGTPVISRSDGLGRVFLVEERNADGSIRRNRSLLDALGNPVLVSDPRDLAAFVYVRDMTGRVFSERSADAGIKQVFIDALDRPVHAWDGRGAHQRIDYDSWGRVSARYVDDDAGPERLTDRFVYGEDPDTTGAAGRNIRGRLVEYYDQAGVTRIWRYDPSGNVLEKERRLTEDFKNSPDWGSADAVEWMAGDPFVTRNAYDALGRPVSEKLPDSTIRTYSYLQGGSLNRITIDTVDGLVAGWEALAGSSYNARGQRTRAVYGNGIAIDHEYDPLTFRLRRTVSSMLREDGRPSRLYQDLRYVYDPVGNLTHITDAGRPTDDSLFNEPRINRYSYDAFYRLAFAEGRTHRALQKNDDPKIIDAPGFIKGTYHIGLDNADLVERYREEFEYDLSGNLRSMTHDSGTGPTGGRWRRDFWISGASNRSLDAEDPSGFEPSDPESRFDSNGNCTKLPHLRSVRWNYQNQLSSAVFVAREDGEDDAEYYVYGGDGARVRKVWVHVVDGNTETVEKIYLDGCEMKRIRLGHTTILERFTSFVSDEHSRIALMHRWTLDTRGRETDDAARPRIHYRLTDHLGSTAFELDEYGAIISYEEPFPFGGTAFIAGERSRDIRIADYRYAGKERDDATGFYYFGFRYYAPWICRWLNPDPAGAKDSLNLYVFTKNNPVNLKDDNGLQSSVMRDVPVQFLTELPETAHPEPGAQAFIRDRSGDGGWQYLYPESVRSLVSYMDDPVIGFFDPNGTIRERFERETGVSGPGAQYFLEYDIGSIAEIPDESPAESDTGAGEEDADSGASGEARSGEAEPVRPEDSAGTGDSGTGTGSTVPSTNPGAGTGDTGREGLEMPRGSRTGTGSTGTAGSGRALGDPRGRPGGTGTGRRTEHVPGVPVGENPEELGERSPQAGSMSPRSIPGGDPNGSITGPEAVNSELPAGNGDPNGSPEGVNGGSPDARPPEELAWWQWALIITAVIVVAIITAGAAAYLIGAASLTLAAVGAEAAITIGLSAEALSIIGAGAGLVGGLASDAVMQGMTIGFGAQEEFNWAQFAFSGITGMLTGGMGGYLSAGRAAVTAGTSAARSMTVGSVARSAATRFAAGAAEGAGLEIFRQGVFGEEFNARSALFAGLIGGGVSAGVQGAFDVFAARAANRGATPHAESGGSSPDPASGGSDGSGAPAIRRLTDTEVLALQQRAEELNSSKRFALGVLAAVDPSDETQAIKYLVGRTGSPETGRSVEPSISGLLNAGEEAVRVAGHPDVELIEMAIDRGLVPIGIGVGGPMVCNRCAGVLSSFPIRHALEATTIVPATTRIPMLAKSFVSHLNDLSMGQIRGEHLRMRLEEMLRKRGF